MVTAMRVVVSLTVWQSALLLGMVALLFVAVVLLANIARTSRAGFLRLSSLLQDAQQKAAGATAAPSRLVRVDPSAPEDPGDEARVRAGFEEFGPMTETEHNMARIQGRDALRRARSGH